MKTLVTSKGTLTLKKNVHNKKLEFCVYLKVSDGISKKTWLLKHSASERLEELLVAFPELRAEDLSEDFKTAFAPGEVAIVL